MINTKKLLDTFFQKAALHRECKKEEKLLLEFLEVCDILLSHLIISENNSDIKFLSKICMEDIQKNLNPNEFNKIVSLLEKEKANYEIYRDNTNILN